MSVNNLLKGYSQQKTIDATTEKDPLYNPSIPQINNTDLVKTLRELKFKDQYYTMMKFDNQLKNGDGFTLGTNSKYLKKWDYDRQIDSNYLRRQNPKNQKHTDSNDFYNGLTNGYYDIPKKIPRIKQAIDRTAIDPMDAYQYKSRFIDSGTNTNTNTKPIIDNSTTTLTLPDKPAANILNDIKTIASDPTQDHLIIEKKAMDEYRKKYTETPSQRINKIKSSKDIEYQKILDEIERQRRQSLLDMSPVKTKYDYDDPDKDKYGNPILRGHTTVNMNISKDRIDGRI